MLLDSATASSAAEMGGNGAGSSGCPSLVGSSGGRWSLPPPTGVVVEVDVVDVGRSSGATVVDVLVDVVGSVIVGRDGRVMTGGRVVDVVEPMVVVVVVVLVVVDVEVVVGEG